MPAGAAGFRPERKSAVLLMRALTSNSQLPTPNTQSPKSKVQSSKVPRASRQPFTPGITSNRRDVEPADLSHIGDARGGHEDAHADRLRAGSADGRGRFGEAPSSRRERAVDDQSATGRPFDHADDARAA